MASSSWDKRNAAARAKGYRNYYDYRVHRYGALLPQEPVREDERLRLAGKRGPAALRRTLRQPDRIALIVEVGGPRTTQGTWESMIYVVTYTNGDIREFEVHTPSAADLDDWRIEIEDAGVDFLEYSGKVGSERKAA